MHADFAGNAHSRHGYIIMYKGVPITSTSQLQTETALSSTDSEYTGLSYALREVIPIMHLLKEMKMMGFPITKANAKIYCKVFEDNWRIGNSEDTQVQTKNKAFKC